MKRLPFLPLLLSLLLATSTLAAQKLPGTTQSGSPAEPAPASDQLGRDTPSGTVFGFLQAAQEGNYKAAAEYLQMSAARRQSVGPTMAQQLQALLNSAFVGNLRRISTRPEGNPDNGGTDRQVIGEFANGDVDVPVVLVRITDSNSNRIWLFSSETLSKVAELYDNLEARQVEKSQYMPRVLVGRLFLGLALWQWLALLVTVPIAAAIGFAAVWLLAVPHRLWLKYRRRPVLYFYRPLAVPLWVVFGATAHRVIAGYFGLALLPRFYYGRTVGTVVTIGFFWFVLRATGLTMQRLRTRAITAGRTGTGTLMVLGERLLKAAVVVIGGLAILGILGFNLTTLLAGLGIGGLAIAFAAQKTLENLFGGVSVLADEVIRVGDTCRFGDRIGTVEDISLRSTRIRTPDRTELSIPNGALAAMNVENFARRDKVLFNPTLAIRHDTTPDQLRYLLAELRRMIYQHAKIEHESARVRLASIDSSALSIEIFGYILTQDFNEFAAIREDVLLRVLAIVEESGSAVGSPASTVYIARDKGPHKERTEAAEQQVQQWRDQRQLPFPDFAPADKSALRGAITFPGPESAVANRR